MDGMSTWRLISTRSCGVEGKGRGCLLGRNESHNAITLQGLQPTTSLNSSDF